MIKTHLALEQLENEVWGEPEFSSHVVTRCHELRKIALKDFQIEDMRLMIGQGFGLEYLMPLAIEELKNNISSKGDFYEGDLLISVIGERSKKYWNSNLNSWKSLKVDIENNIEVFDHKIQSKIQDRIKFIES